jgi:hypothetical protein
VDHIDCGAAGVVSVGDISRLCHVFAAIDAYPAELHIVRARFLNFDEINPWSRNDRAFLDLPMLEYAFDVGFVSGGEGLLDLSTWSFGCFNSSVTVIG